MITLAGKPNLGGAVGTLQSLTKHYMKCKVRKWSEELLHLFYIPQTMFSLANVS